MVKNLLQCKRPGFNPWVRKIPWRREWLPTPVFLPGEFHRQRSLAGYSPWSHKELNRTDRLTPNTTWVRGCQPRRYNNFIQTQIMSCYLAFYQDFYISNHPPSPQLVFPSFVSHYFLLSLCSPHCLFSCVFPSGLICFSFCFLRPEWNLEMMWTCWCSKEKTWASALRGRLTLSSLAGMNVAPQLLRHPFGTRLVVQAY